MTLQQEPNMHIYSAYVRANGQVIQTQVCANNISDAINLFKGMYGSDNLVHLPQLVR
jgi:ribosomal protein L28